MFRSITTEYRGPTDKLGTRIIVRSDKLRMIVACSNPSEEDHMRAAKDFAIKHGWFGSWYGGALGSGYVFVLSRTARNQPNFFVA